MAGDDRWDPVYTKTTMQPQNLFLQQICIPVLLYNYNTFVGILLLQYKSLLTYIEGEIVRTLYLRYWSQSALQFIQK